MSYKKIIPCLDLENALEMAKFYNDAGADEIAYFDSKATKEGREANIAVIKEICKNVDIPLIACGGEDWKISRRCYTQVLPRFV